MHLLGLDSYCLCFFTSFKVRIGGMFIRSEGMLALNVIYFGYARMRASNLILKIKRFNIIVLS